MGVLSAILVCAVGGQAFAEPLKLTQRSVDIHSPKLSAVVPYTFRFDVGSPTPIESIQFLFCDSPLQSEPCVAPTGLSAAGANLAAQSGATGFGLDAHANNELKISRAPTVNASGYVQLQFNNMVNPSVAGTFFVRILTYPTQDASGPNNAYGAVAAATLLREGIFINTEVPPILVFCVGITIPGDCSTAQNYEVELGTLSSTRVAGGTSQMYAATNANFGLTITVNGETLTSGNDVIPALAQPSSSAPGNGQFGINLRANQDPPVGTEPSGSGVTTPTPAYNQPNSYTFRNGDIMAASTGTTDYRKFTVSYIANVPAAQPPGVYNTTLTYICTGTF